MYAVLKVEPRAWHMLGKHSTTGYIPSLNISFKRPGIGTLLCRSYRRYEEATYYSQGLRLNSRNLCINIESDNDVLAFV